MEVGEQDTSLEMGGGGAEKLGTEVRMVGVVVGEVYIGIEIASVAMEVN